MIYKFKVPLLVLMIVAGAVTVCDSWYELLVLLASFHVAAFIGWLSSEKLYKRRAEEEKERKRQLYKAWREGR